MTGTTQFSETTGFWTVTDENGGVWDAVTTESGGMVIQRETANGYEGAVWVGYPGGSTRGEIHRRNDGDVAEGYDCNCRYEFDSRRGWVETAN